MMNNNTIATVNTAIVTNDSHIIGKDSKGRDTIIPMITSVSQYSTLFPTQSWEALSPRDMLWDGVGKDVSHCLSTDAVFELAGLNYGIEKVPTYIKRNDFYGKSLNGFDLIAQGSDLIQIPVYAIVRDDNVTYLGNGTERLNPLANEKTRELCNVLFSLGFRFENAGVFDGGKVTYVSMKWKGDVLSGEAMDYYVVIINSFDGTKPFGIYITPVRISCKNTMNLAIKQAVRFWKIKHTRTAEIRLNEVQQSLMAFDHYIKGLDTEIDRMKMLTLNDKKVMSFFETLFPVENGMTQRMIDNSMRQREELAYRYLNAPDLDGMEQSGFRLMCAVTDFADHAMPQRNTQNWKANRFLKNMSGANELIDMTQQFIDSQF
jgi:phage/plasmid-like protein (TIGR03299 family)